MILQKTNSFNPPDNNPRKCDRYEANKRALILLARANVIKTEAPTSENEGLHARTLDLAVDEINFCKVARSCEIIEQCRKQIDQDLGIHGKSE